MDVHPTKNVSIGIDPYPFGRLPEVQKLVMEIVFDDSCGYSAALFDSPFFAQHLSGLDSNHGLNVIDTGHRTLTKEYHLVMTNIAYIAMENGPLADDFPSELNLHL